MTTLVQVMGRVPVAWQWTAVDSVVVNDTPDRTPMPLALVSGWADLTLSVPEARRRLHLFADAYGLQVNQPETAANGRRPGGPTGGLVFANADGSPLRARRVRWQGLRPGGR
ncbi:hypothetical protein [Kitasatospora purpeofusca]|uniref:hypothetical protein n=1 Tax=Kitasatospora purpeofusca TaxID=67352 RepID=UPI00386F1ACA|nr:hypothetical protein OIP63_38895 [Kitasatospora purpeofusca]